MERYSLHVAKLQSVTDLNGCKVDSNSETPQDTTHLSAVFVQFTSVLSALAVGVPSKTSLKGTRKGARIRTGDLHGRAFCGAKGECGGGVVSKSERPKEKRK
jgi:hypothetical protein